ncbi:hypothetical protein [Prosthecobacter sp.]|jgi:hypothetical protein|uniref:hypothetical protein n=1 Tax=Prosthecobacter sp. TaxID=1965333 RepID=UPI0037832958
MKRKLLPALGALLLATSLTSCYVYDDPLTWGAPCPAPVYRPGFCPSPVLYPRPVVYPTRGFGGYSHCAPRPPVCNGGFGRVHHGWH